MSNELPTSPTDARRNSKIREALEAGISVASFPFASKNSAYWVGSQSAMEKIFHEYNEECSNINFLSRALLSMASVNRYLSSVSPHRRSITLIKDSSTGLDPAAIKVDVEPLKEKFAQHVTSAMNENNYWGCFYIFPELYDDRFSPVVRIREVSDVPELVGGVLTRDMIAAHLTYLRRNPILGDFVYIKLDLKSMRLQNIDILMHYKFLVYLDLSTNFLTTLNVLSKLPYLQFLNVSFNSLSTVLDYETPQWFLTEAHYRYNSIRKIRDLTAFWSLTVLDLSHNNIKVITGLETLMYLRRLDLSFNHIQTLENLDHLRLLWLDVSYNNISRCEFTANSGLWTLLHLEYLNLNENNLTSLKMFCFCVRLRELYLRNNRLGVMLEIPVYMRQLRRLSVLDLRANPICSAPGYKAIIFNTFSQLLNLDAVELDPIEQRTLIMDTRPDITSQATRRLLRLLYIEQLSKAKVSPYTPPADTTDVPIVVLVGHEGVGKGTLSRRLATECSSNVQRAVLHTTAKHHPVDHYKVVTRAKFDEMLIAGEFLTYSEMSGESYGLSREEAYVKEGKVKVVCLDLPAALMLKLRGYQPYLILVTRLDLECLKTILNQRKTYQDMYNQQSQLMENRIQRSMLQVMLSGRLIITGILNEIILDLPEEKDKSEFIIEPECSLMMDSDVRQRDTSIGFNIIAFLNADSSLLDVALKQGVYKEDSLYSLFKGSQTTMKNTSDVGNFQDRNTNRGKRLYVDEARRGLGMKLMVTQPRTGHGKHCKTLRNTLLITVAPEQNRQPKEHGENKSSSGSSAYTPARYGGSKASKSVTFTGNDDNGTGATENLSGMMIEPEKPQKGEPVIQTISTRMPWSVTGLRKHGSNVTMDSDLWLAFLIETGYLDNSELNTLPLSDAALQRYVKPDDDIIRQLNNMQFLADPSAMGLRDSYELLHRQCPGLFWSTVTTDDAEKAFIKLRKIIRDIVNSQKKLKPMIDIDFAHLRHYPTVQRKLNKIRNQIAPQQLFR